MSFYKKLYWLLFFTLIMANLTGILFTAQAASNELGSVFIPPGGRANGVTVVGNLAYVGSRNYFNDVGGVMTIIDVSDPTDPFILGTLDKQDQVQDIVVAGDYAYYADDGYGLSIADVSDPANPAKVSVVNELGEAVGIALLGDYAYVTGPDTDVEGQGLSIINIADPLNPELVGKLPADDFVDVDVSGNLAYVVSNIITGLHVVDISKKSSPVEVEFLPLDVGVGRIDVVDSLAYIASGGDGLTIVDISNPVAPFVRSSVLTNNCVDVDIESNIAISAEGESGFAVIDISDPDLPTLMYTVDTPGNVSRLDISDSLVYIVDGDELRIFQIDEISSISAVISIKPETLNPKSNGKWISCYISFPESYSVEDINPDSILLEDTIGAENCNIQNNVLMVKFDRSMLIEYLDDTTGEVILTVTGELNSGIAFEGVDTIRVIKKGKKAPTQSIVFKAPEPYPKPANPEVWIPYILARDVEVNINIYDANGRIIREIFLGNQSAGTYITKEKSAYWNGRNEAEEQVSSGIYFYTIQAGDFAATRKILITR